MGSLETQITLIKLEKEEVVEQIKLLKQQEIQLGTELKEKYGEDFFQYDKTIECGCSRKIPDWFRDCFKFALNIECDEEQHKSRDTSCENKRLVQLFLDCANRPFICLRFNPDKYINKNGEKAIKNGVRKSIKNRTSIFSHFYRFLEHFGSPSEVRF